MEVSKTRGVTKKSAPNSIGNKIVRFRVPNVDRRFTIHEDLICCTSTFFKTQLQKNRKPLQPDTNPEECCVCQEDLNPTTKDITYCVSCGQNIHDTCIEQWKRTSNQDRPPPTCPMCRAPWKNEPLLKSLTVTDTLDAEAVQIYLNWLYSSTLHIPASISRKSDAFNVVILKCWAVAIAMDDILFRNNVLCTFFRDAEAQFWRDSVEWVFVQGNGNAEIKDFVVEAFMAFMKLGWFSKEAMLWPEVFVREVGDRALGLMKGRRGWREIRRAWSIELEEGMDGGGVREEIRVEVGDRVGSSKRRCAADYVDDGDSTREVKRTKCSVDAERALADSRSGAGLLL